MTGIVIGTILFPIIIATVVVYVKNVNEKEQLVLGVTRSVVWYKIRIKHINRLPISITIGSLFFIDI